ncbi:MAG: choice-of-anchor tandem repeat GloVer-containing protein [Stellaceae bacterium]
MRNMLSPVSAAALGLAIAALAAGPCGAATLQALATFNGSNGNAPNGGLIGDAAGNLFGTTEVGGGASLGTVFVIAKTIGGYANMPTTLVDFSSFDGASGRFPAGGLIADFNGNLFGTTKFGGPLTAGTVYEVIKSAGGYAATPTLLASFSGANGTGANPVGSLFADTHGNLFGATVAGGTSNNGTVFEIRKDPKFGFLVPITLVSFSGSDGAQPVGSLIADANGNLFGTTAAGGINNNGTVFEIVNTANGYATTPALLAAFHGPDGSAPEGGLILDANGNLFGTTTAGGMTPTGGTNIYGTVFELVKTPNGYASTLTTLVSFNSTDGSFPTGSLILDAKGNLFGTTATGGDRNLGTAFKIAKTANGYATTPTVVVSFNRLADGLDPSGGLIADTAGNLFGAAGEGGANHDGTVFAITGSGFAPPLTFAGRPGRAHCFGDSMLALQRHGNLDTAARARGFRDAEALQTAILRYCRPVRAAAARY